MNPGKHERRKRLPQELYWTVHDRAQSFVLWSYAMNYKLRNQII